MLQVIIPFSLRNTEPSLEIVPSFDFFPILENKPIQVGSDKIFISEITSFSQVYSDFDIEKQHLLIEFVETKAGMGTVYVGTRISLINVIKETSSFVEVEYLVSFGVPQEVGTTLKIKKISSLNRNFYQLN